MNRKTENQPDIDITASGDCGKRSGLDLIRRQDVIDAIMEKVNSNDGQYNDYQLYMWGLFTQIIQELPTAEKAGKWILCSDEYGDSWVCSECGEEYVLTDGDISEQRYCPNCGSRNEVEDDN